MSNLEILQELEKKHGGAHRVKQKNGTVNRGGDRFTVHDYAPFYDFYMPADPKVIVEIGILTGTGLRIWSDLFSNARIIGLDIFPENVTDPGRAEVHYFDQLNPQGIEEILNGDRIDFCIDDGLHTVESQLKTYEYFKPYVDGVYIIEDIDKGYDITKDLPSAVQVGRIATL